LDEHIPVLVEETLAALAVQPAGLYADATFGRGGHTARILQSLGPDGRVIALDRDPAAIAAGRSLFAHEPRLTLVHSAFDRLAEVVLAHSGLAHSGRSRCDGILFDLGVSSPQLADPQRGLSFTLDGPLDMRLDPGSGEPLSVWLARAQREEIRAVIAELGEERFANRIAAQIVRAREQQPLRSSAELAALVARSVRTHTPGRHPATRTFQALRLHVNDELGQLRRALPQALELLAPGGRLAAISFHSLEDRIVKQFVRAHSEIDPALQRLPVLPPQTRPPLRRVGRKQRPSEQEIAANPRSRSAVLRVAERVA
jgi:16S rRNA (cytosine1402-N4)-methyltransferase